MKYILITIVSLFFSLVVCAADKHDIKFDIKNYDQKEVIIGYYYGQQTLVLDTLVSDNNIFQLQGDSLLESGVYLMLTVPDNQFVQFLINQDDQEFDVWVDAQNLAEVKVAGSVDNELFYSHLDFIKSQRAQAEVLGKEKARFKELGQDTSEFEKKYSDLDDEVLAHQKMLIENNPESISALLLKGNLQIDIPEFEGAENEVQELKYNYIRNHYFDRLDFQDPAMLRTPFFHKRIDYYLNKLTPQSPDSIIVVVDRLLEDFKGNDDLRKYYMSYFLNTYSKMKIVGFDAVYVHVAEKYYATGEASWVSEENLGKIMNNAKKLKPILIGKTAPDFTIYKEDKSKFALKDVDTEYTLLFFWAPDCGHCKKAIPHLNDFRDTHKDLDITILSICNKTGDKFEECWSAIEEKDLTGYINLGDQYQKSRILSNYYVKSTPKIFILDKEKKILLKDIGAESLPDIFKELERRRMESLKSVK